MRDLGLIVQLMGEVSSQPIRMADVWKVWFSEKMGSRRWDPLYQCSLFTQDSFILQRTDTPAAH